MGKNIEDFEKEFDLLMKKTKKEEQKAKLQKLKAKYLKNKKENIKTTLLNIFACIVLTGVYIIQADKIKYPSQHWTYQDKKWEKDWEQTISDKKIKETQHATYYGNWNQSDPYKNEYHRYIWEFTDPKDIAQLSQNYAKNNRYDIPSEILEHANIKEEYKEDIISFAPELEIDYTIVDYKNPDVPAKATLCLIIAGAFWLYTIVKINNQVDESIKEKKRIQKLQSDIEKEN